MPDTLQVPGQQPPISASTGSGKPLRLKRSKSPHGKPRKQPPARPLTPKEQFAKIKKHPYFWPAVFLFVSVLFSLIYSALRIATVDPNSQPFTPPKPPASSNAPSTPSAATIVLDEKARQAALRRTWELEDARVKAASAGGSGEKGNAHDPKRWKELQDAMKDLDADALTNMLHESYQKT